MSVILGSGEHRYRVVENWAKLPDGWSLTDAASVAVDSKDRIYVFNRGDHPMVVLDREGNFITSWGEGLFNRAHGLHIDADDNLYCTDDGDHTVRKCTTDGKVLLTIGIPNKPAPFMSGEPFHRCTHTALSPQGDIYVSDGYGNACVHKYSPDGKLLKTWGEPGQSRPAALDRRFKRQAHRPARRRERPGPGGRQVPRAARHRDGFQG
jgi:DNA-binding beta-propeller fold protein YncE